ncbi:hypothetical protein [Burkholderia cenocepacia]|uniref:hypothetical protein n=1 Tax=Burkholderia cenocepacia TaxID=95486 RepID=UPI000B0FE68C|nr:hypothetical protein [Burkholderia cenocepacia]
MSEAIQAAAPVEARQPRKDLVPPAVISEGMSLFDYLTTCRPPADQKIIDIACSQTQVPHDLKQEAAQEIRVMWMTLKPDTVKYKPGQIAAYAHRMALHAALRARRDLGSAVRLPGSAFRKRKDGSSYVTPGVLATALEWDKLEGWFQADGVEGDGGPVSDAISSDLGLSPLLGGDEPMVEEDDDEVTRDERMDVLEAARDDLTPRQFEIMKALIAGNSFEEVMKEQDIKKGVLMREMAIISSIVGVLD